MSTTDEDGEEIPGRETAYRLFAAEYDDATLSYAESDEERAPNYVISPTGARLNRAFVVGTLTEVTSVNEEMVRARVVDPTGAFVVYAGQYQPDELATLETLEAPEFVAVTGKARTFQPDDSDQVYTSLRPESIATVDAATRDRWVVSAAERTLERIGTYAAVAALEADAASLDGGDDAVTDALGEAGVDDGLAAGIPLARDHYGTTPAYLAALRDRAREAVEVVAGRRDQVTARSFGPAGSSPDYESASFESLAALSDVDLEGLEAALSAESSAGDDGDAPDTQSAQAATPTAGGAGSEPESDTVDTGSAAGTATGTDADASSAAEVSDAGVESTPETDAGDDGPADADSDDEAGEEERDDFDTEADDEELGDFDGDSGMYEMDDEEREQLEEEFGAEFATGSEVDEPGSADIDVPEPDEEPAVDDDDEPAGDLGAPPESGLEADSETEPDTADTAASESADDAAETAAESERDDEERDDEVDEEDGADESAADPLADVDLQEYVVETMSKLDDGDGADRMTLVETVADDTGVSEDEIEDAIQDALMSGQCYEPGDDRLTAI